MGSLKVDEKLVALVGEEKAKLITLEIVRITAETTAAVDEVVRTRSELSKNTFVEMFSNPEYAENQDVLLDYVRSLVGGSLGCDLLKVSGEIYATFSLSYGEYAAHALDHYETAKREHDDGMQVIDLGELLMRMRNSTPKTE